MFGYKEVKAMLEASLSKSAFRRGATAHRLGLIPEGISDHLPIIIKILGDSPTTLVSWNMLAEVHLYNNFRNITGTKKLAAVLSADNMYAGTEDENKLYYYFSELSQFLYEKQVQQSIFVDNDLLRQFNSIKNCGSHLTLSEHSKISRKKELCIEQSRNEIAKLLLNDDFGLQHEMKLAIQHSVDLIYHIKNKQGALKWSNRLERLKNEHELLATLNKTDFLCLQECTNPADVQTLMSPKEAFIFRVNDTTNDHCVIFYDPTKFQPLGDPLFFALSHGKKPCILARFENREDGTQMIIGSIHHPGGKENLITEIIEKLVEFTQNQPIKFYLAGDYNHTEDFFQNEYTPLYQMLYPTLETMAGTDFGNTNKSIDALLTNDESSRIQIERVSYLHPYIPSEMPVRIFFKKDQSYECVTNTLTEADVEAENADPNEKTELAHKIQNYTRK